MYHTNFFFSSKKLKWLRTTITKKEKKREKGLSTREDARYMDAIVRPSVFNNVSTSSHSHYKIPTKKKPRQSTNTIKKQKRKNKKGTHTTIARSSTFVGQVGYHCPTDFAKSLIGSKKRNKSCFFWWKERPRKLTCGMIKPRFVTLSFSEPTVRSAYCDVHDEVEFYTWNWVSEQKMKTDKKPHLDQTESQMSRSPKDSWAERESIRWRRHWGNHLVGRRACWSVGREGYAGACRRRCGWRVGNEWHHVVGRASGDRSDQGKRGKRKEKPSVSQSNNRQSMREIMFLRNKKSDKNKKWNKRGCGRR